MIVLRTLSRFDSQDETVSLRQDIEEERKLLDLDKDAFGEVSLHTYDEILKNVWSVFTELGHTAKNHFWINHHITNKVTYDPSNELEVLSVLKEIVPYSDTLWFIGQETKNESPKYWLYESTLDAAINILSEMYFFDFYLVDKKYKWIVSEEHHGLLIASGEPVSKSLAEYKKLQDLEVC